MSTTILEYPNSKLNRPCSKLHPHHDVRGLYKKLCEALPADGVGISANQIGERGRMFVLIDEDGTMIPYINPIIEYLSDTPKVRTVERCLSFPGKEAKIERLAWIKIKWVDLDFRKHTATFPDVKGIAIQHELDHLDGITIADRAVNGITDIPDGDQDGHK